MGVGYAGWEWGGGYMRGEGGSQSNPRMDPVVNFTNTLEWYRTSPGGYGTGMSHQQNGPEFQNPDGGFWNGRDFDECEGVQPTDADGGADGDTPLPWVRCWGAGG